MDHQPRVYNISTKWVYIEVFLWAGLRGTPSEKGDAKLSKRAHPIFHVIDDVEVLFPPGSAQQPNLSL